MNKNYYLVLGVNKNSSIDEIKKAFRQKAQKYHPDKNSNDLIFNQKFREIKLAYDTLKDLNKREKYDLSLKNDNIDFTKFVSIITNNFNKILIEKGIEFAFNSKNRKIDDYLRVVFQEEYLDIFQRITDRQKKDFFYNLIPIFKFLNSSQIEFYRDKINLITKDNNALNTELNLIIQLQKKKNRRYCINKFFKRYWRVIILLLISFIYFLSNL